jgi:hypothetical protein
MFVTTLEVIYLHCKFSYREEYPSRRNTKKGFSMYKVVVFDMCGSRVEEVDTSAKELNDTVARLERENFFCDVVVFKDDIAQARW